MPFQESRKGSEPDSSPAINDDQPPLDFTVRRSKRKIQVQDAGSKETKMIRKEENTIGLDPPSEYKSTLGTETNVLSGSAMTSSEHQITQKHDPLDSSLPPRPPLLDNRMGFDNWIKAKRLKLRIQEEANQPGGERSKKHNNQLEKQIAQDRKDKGNAISSVLREVFYSMGGWTSPRDVRPTLRDTDSQPVFWVAGWDGEQLLRPAWDVGFDKNWSEWGAEFMVKFRQKSKEHRFARHLAKDSTDRIRRRLRDGEWTACSLVARRRQIQLNEENKQGKMITSPVSLQIQQEDDQKLLSSTQPTSNLPFPPDDLASSLANPPSLTSDIDLSYDELSLPTHIGK
ncbi:hypothetical protein RhiJN_20330 [Ceratobasidium sp. AG-Ba]|nr:hypothetical protein RhiJN_20330 [Ceratobasidium sp. AG-Ba]